MQLAETSSTEPLDKASARRELGLPEDGQFIGTVSSLVPYEGIEDLLAAFVRLAADIPHLRLLIVGDGSSMPSLQIQAQRSGFASRIVFTGRVPRSQAALYHQALDVFVVPRKDLEVTRSVTPLKPVEAMACARPVVASDLPALAELVEDRGDRPPGRGRGPCLVRWRDSGTAHGSTARSSSSALRAGNVCCTRERGPPTRLPWHESWKCWE